MGIFPSSLPARLLPTQADGISKAFKDGEKQDLIGAKHGQPGSGMGERE